MSRARRRERQHDRERRRARELRRLIESPCNRPPAAPVPTLTARATEALTHLRFTLKVKWPAVELDTSGLPVNVDLYKVVVRAVDDLGDPVETEDGKVVYRSKVKPRLFRIGVSSAVIISGTLAEFTTRGPHGFEVGEDVTVTGLAPAGYNGNWVVTATLSPTTFRADIGTSPGPSTSSGGVFDNADSLHVIFGPVPRPRTWSWEAKIAAHSSDGCWSAWSPWTSPPLLPWTGADPKPPVPENVDLDFDTIEKGRHDRIRAVSICEEVVDFDYPGSPADDETDVAFYEFALQKSEDGVDPDPPHRRHLVRAKDEDADSIAKTVWLGIRKRFKYRTRARTVDRFERVSLWSDWTDWMDPIDDGPPPTPLNVTIYDKGVDRVIMDWDGALDPDDSELLDQDIAYFQAQISKSPLYDPDTGFTTPWKFDRYVHSTRKAFKVKDTDAIDVFYGMIRAVDASGNKSQWVPAWDPNIGGHEDGNDDPLEPPDGVIIGKGSGGMIVATFTKPGRLRVRHYPYRWTNTTDDTLEFRRARAVVGNRNDPPGSHAAGTDGHPIGSAVKVNIRRWLADESAHEPVFQTGVGADDDDRLKIDAGTHKDTNPVDTFEITQLEPDEAISIKIPTVGSTFPGEDLVVQVFMRPV